jgi:hypothetical protein
MDELIAHITQQTGISHDQARQTVQIFSQTITKQLPPPIAEQVESVLGEKPSGGMIEHAKEMLGGLFGHKE